MKKLCLLIAMAVMPVVTIAQNYDSYLREAKEHLEQGNVESAKKAYLVYQRMTDKTDAGFEELLKEYEHNTLWMRSCYIVKINDSTSVAVQKLDSSQIKVEYSTAEISAKSSRLGGFCDWRLPQESELHVIISNIPLNDLLFESYWAGKSFCSARREIVIKNRQNGQIINKCISYNESSRFKIVDRINNINTVYEYSMKKEDGKIISKDEAGDEHTSANYLIVRTLTETDNQK